MSKIRAEQYTNRAGTGAPSFPNGVTVTGVITATSFSGSIAGTASSAIVATNAYGLVGSPNINVGSVTGTTGTFSGNVSVGGTLTYDDVTNVDSVGLITARNGINVTAGISTFKGANFNGGSLIKEKCHVVAGKLSDNVNIDLENGMIHLFTTQETATSAPVLRMSASKTLNSVMDVGDTIVVTLMTTAAAAGYQQHVLIDGVNVTEKWIGGAAPTGGGSSGIDTYSYTITKLSNAPTWNVIANLTNAA